MQVADSSTGYRKPSDFISEIVAGAYILIALIAGGGPQGLGDQVIYLSSVPVLLLAFSRLGQVQLDRWKRIIIGLWLMTLVMVGLQLLPLPVSWIERLPMRSAVIEDLNSAGVNLKSMPITLAKWATVRGFLAVTATFAIFLLAMTLNVSAKQRLLKLTVIAAVLMALVGFAQAGAGEHSQLRPFPYHHPIGAIGSFANRNHFACFMAMMIPFGILFASKAANRGRQTEMVLWYAALIILTLAAALSFSRTGILLSLMAFVAGFWIVPKKVMGSMRLAVPLLVVGLIVLAVYTYAYSGIAARLAQDPLADLRFQYLNFGEIVVGAYWPIGSGFGSFPWVYAPFEPVEAMTSSYAARAHNDPLQLAIGGGAFAVAMMAAWLIAIVALALRNFRKSVAKFGGGMYVHRVASIALMIPLVHSLVDYPLRTMAISTTFALFLAVSLFDQSEKPEAQA